MGVIVLGIDPGTANTGYGVVALRGSRLVALDGGVIATRPEAPMQLRLASIHRRVGELLDEHAVAAVALEEIYLGRNAQSAFAVGQARGAAIVAAGQRRLPCASYTPQQVKRAVCGSGRADKEQVARMVARLLALTAPPRPDHAADALAVAICHANGGRLAEAVAAAGTGEPGGSAAPGAESRGSAGPGAELGDLAGPGAEIRAYRGPGARQRAAEEPRDGAPGEP